jgi:hypothetical protein
MHFRTSPSICGRRKVIVTPNASDLLGEIMRKTCVGFLSASVIATACIASAPAAAITFSKLTTIYIGGGIVDSGGTLATGKASVFHCANVSGFTATVRVLVLNENGSPRGNFTTNVPHAGAITVATHPTNAYIAHHNINTGSLAPGAVNIESTQSGVFCTAETINAADTVPVGVTRNLVRVNPHPGTVE